MTDLVLMSSIPAMDKFPRQCELMIKYRFFTKM